MTQQNDDTLPNLPPLDESFADHYYDELAQMDVQLDADPLQYGPKRLNGKIALARKHLSRVERIFLDLSRKHARYKRGFRAATLIFEQEKKHLLANDPEVRAGRAVSERDAIASQKLRAESQAVATCEHAVAELETVIAVVKSKRSDLKDIQGRLRDQMKVCQEELGLGSRWGSKPPPGRGIELEPGQGVADGSDVENVNDLIKNVRAVADDALHLPAEIDDSDPEEEQEEALAASADLPSRDDNVPAPVVPLVDEDDEFEDAALTAPLNGEPAVPEDDDPLAGVEEAEGTVLEATATPDDVADFLDSPTLTAAKAPEKGARRQIEDMDEALDIDGILANFSG